MDDAATSYWILQEMERETNKDITKHDALVFDMNNNDNFTLSDSLWATFSYCSVHHSIFPNIRMNLSGGEKSPESFHHDVHFAPAYH